MHRGNTVRPLMFILATAYIIEALKTDRQIVRPTRGNHEIAVFIDYVKCHAPTRGAGEVITEVLGDAAGKIGLALNFRKCNIYFKTIDVA